MFSFQPRNQSKNHTVLHESYVILLFFIAFRDHKHTFRIVESVGRTVKKCVNFFILFRFLPLICDCNQLYSSIFKYASLFLYQLLLQKKKNLVNGCHLGLFSAIRFFIQQISSRLEITGASIVERRMKPEQSYLDHRLIKVCLIPHDSWLPWKHISMYFR